MLPPAMSSTVEAPSAPRNTEEGRALLQARLSQFGRVGMGLSATFLLLASAVTLILHLPGGLATVLSQLCWFGISCVVWLITRRGAMNMAALLALDATATLAHCVVGIALGWALPLYARPELIQLFFVNDVLALRAFLVPSTPVRTALLGALSAAGVVGSMLIQYGEHRLAPDAPSPGSLAVVTAMLGFATVVITTLTSRTIFSLRERVRAALQLGQYTLLEKLGQGGMGVVYKASHAMLKRPTAIKVLPPERAGQHNLARFEREVQLTSMLTHPNTVSIYDYGRTPDGCFYYAMEYLDGVDLETLVALDGPQHPARVVHVLSQVCGALAEAHSIGLVHRDVKPANILVCVRGGIADLAKIVDFGLVKSLQGGNGDGAYTSIDQIVGTPLYMAPETMTTPNSFGPRSDLYALGAVAYYLLTGTPPFSGQSVVEICAHHLHSTPKPISERSPHAVPEALERVVMACLAKRQEDRPESADELARRLAASDVPAWSNEQARAWWDAHAELVRKRREETSQSFSPDGLDRATVAVRLSSRGSAKRAPKASRAGFWGPKNGRN